MTNNEITIDYIGDINEIEITDLLLNKKLEIEKDYTILNIN